MANEIQETDDGKQESSLPANFDPQLFRLRLGYFSYTAVPAGILLEIMTQGQLGESAAVAALLGGTAGYWAPQLHKAIGPGLRAASHVWTYLNRNNSGRARHHLMDKHWWLTGETAVQYADPDEDQRDERLTEELEANKPGESPKAVQEGPWVPQKFRLDDVLEIIHDFNARGYVYFGESEAGSVAIPLADMYHVIDVSSSGKGKSNRFRLAMMQMVNNCETYYINPIAANVKAAKDEREIEVWKPIYERLANKRPVKEGADIEALMRKLIEEIARRNDLEEEGDFTFMDHPIFVFIDELPEVFARCPDAIKQLDKIGRAGRQFLVFCWIASQTALVSEIGQSTAAQANYKTRIYGGGDKTSSNRLMKGALPKDAERTLQVNGAGLTLMLADGIDGVAFTRAPLVTNEALFEYLGLPPFKKEEWIKGRKATSTADGDSTSLPTSTATSTPSTQEVAGSGSTGSGKWPEVDQPLPPLSELERQIGDLFFIERQKKSKIIEQLYPPNARGGNANIKASEEIDEAIRKYAEVARHRAIRMMREEREA